MIFFRNNWLSLAESQWPKQTKHFKYMYMIATEIMFSSLGSKCVLFFHIATSSQEWFPEKTETNIYYSNVWNGPGNGPELALNFFFFFFFYFKKTLGQPIGETFIPAKLITQRDVMAGITPSKTSIYLMKNGKLFLLFYIFGFFGPSKLFHSFSAQTIIRHGKNQILEKIHLTTRKQN